MKYLVMVLDGKRKNKMLILYTKTAINECVLL